MSQPKQSNAVTMYSAARSPDRHTFPFLCSMGRFASLMATSHSVHAGKSFRRSFRRSKKEDCFVQHVTSESVCVLLHSEARLKGSKERLSFLR